MSYFSKRLKRATDRNVLLFQTGDDRLQSAASSKVARDDRVGEGEELLPRLLRQLA